MVKLRIKKDLEWGEYIVQWLENGHIDEDKSYYSGGLGPDDARDTILSAIDMIRRARAYGVQIEFNDDKKTIALVAKYSPEFLIEEMRIV